MVTGPSKILQNFSKINYQRISNKGLKNLEIRYKFPSSAVGFFTDGDIRDFAFQWDSDIKDLCTQKEQAKSGIPRE